MGLKMIEDIKKLINWHDKEYTINKIYEELAELMIAHSKVQLCEVGDLENLREEMADVYIILEILKVMYNIEDREVDYWIDKKMKRNLERIEGGNK